MALFFIIGDQHPDSGYTNNEFKLTLALMKNSLKKKELCHTISLKGKKLSFR